MSRGPGLSEVGHCTLPFSSAQSLSVSPRCQGGHGSECQLLSPCVSRAQQARQDPASLGLPLTQVSFPISSPMTFDVPRVSQTGYPQVWFLPGHGPAHSSWCQPATQLTAESGYCTSHCCPGSFFCAAQDLPSGLPEVLNIYPYHV